MPKAHFDKAIWNVFSQNLSLNLVSQLLVFPLTETVQKTKLSPDWSVSVIMSADSEPLLLLQEGLYCWDPD